MFLQLIMLKYVCFLALDNCFRQVGDFKYLTFQVFCVYFQQTVLATQHSHSEEGFRPYDLQCKRNIHALQLLLGKCNLPLKVHHLQLGFQIKLHLVHPQFWPIVFL